VREFVWNEGRLTGPSAGARSARVLRNFASWHIFVSAVNLICSSLIIAIPGDA
jgi:hypothetical protein